MPMDETQTKTYRVQIACEQDGSVALDVEGVPEPVAKMLLAEAPKLRAAIAGSKISAAPGKLARLLAAKLR